MLALCIEVNNITCIQLLLFIDVIVINLIVN